MITISVVLSASGDNFSEVISHMRTSSFGLELVPHDLSSISTLADRFTALGLEVRISWQSLIMMHTQPVGYELSIQ